MTNVASAAEIPIPTERPAALQVLFDRYHRLVFDAAFRITGNHGDAEDVLQSLFMRLARSGIPPGLRERPEAYLRRAAVNAGIDLVRSRGSERRAMDRQRRWAPVEGPQERDLFERERLSRLRERVRAALGRLGARAAEMIVLRYFEGLTNKEIAALLDTSEGTVAVTLHRARHRLRDELASSLED